jgi:hypothetical protein
MPDPASRRLPVGAHFEETEWVFSPTNSELSLGSLADIYVMAAEFWTTTAPKAPAPVIAA